MVSQPWPLVGLDEDVLGPVDVGDQEVQTVTGMPMARLARTAAAAISGYSRSMTSWIVPPVGRFAVRRTRIRAPAGGTSSIT